MRMIKTVLFDVDGVLLSEERYFDASALTVWETLHSENYLGLEPKIFKTDYHDNEITEIRAKVFANDHVLKFLKSCGLNANWDMIYITVAYQLILLLEQIKDEEKEKIQKWVSEEIDRHVLQDIATIFKGKQLKLDFTSLLTDFSDAERTKDGLLDYLDQIAQTRLEVDKSSFGKIGALWSTTELISQEWYVGDDYVFSSTGRESVQTGKKGFLAYERVLAESDEIAKLFSSLIKAGITIGIGTGRPELETLEPFKHLGWLSYFERNYIVTADDVLRAERELGDSSSLSKPHPYTYVYALSGKKKTIKDCIYETMPIEKGEEVLIVGDSLADYLAAKKMGCTFAAVLTGLSGKDARADFEARKVKYILDDVLEVKDLVLSMNK